MFVVDDVLGKIPPNGRMQRGYTEGTGVLVSGERCALDRSDEVHVGGVWSARGFRLDQF